MNDKLIDVWDVETFDPELRSYLDRQAETISAYWAENNRLFEEREAQTRRGPPTENEHALAYREVREDLKAMLAERTIRAWHFTRLTDPEVAAIRAHGMQPMTIDHIERRLAAVAGAGLIDRKAADALFAASPYHRQIEGNRELRIWLTAQPYPLDDSGVSGLLGCWGGESINFDHLEGATHDLLATIGAPRVVETALPLRITTRIHGAAENVADAYSFTLGCHGGWGGGFDMVAIEPIAAEWIVAVHSPGEAAFEHMGQGYPARFTGDD